MKREIKFRAWDKTYNCWYKPTHRAYEGKLWELLVGFGGDLSAHAIRIGKAELVHESMFPDRYELMQFTGLKDKNGKEVFADDIMRVGEYMFRVYAVPGGFSIKPPFWSRDMGELNTGDELIMNPLGEPQNIAWIRGQCEVIGNIYENPELLSK